MTMMIDLAQPAHKLAAELAKSLDDATFELLVRYRIRAEFDWPHRANPNLSESYNSCRFVFEWNDKCTWHISVGSTYRDQVSINGEVLAKTVVNAMNQYELQHGNKLSLLLPSPEDADE